MQGHGKIGRLGHVETPALIRYGQLTNDEFFITEKAALEGVTIVNSVVDRPDRHAKTFRPGQP
jgi:hypothetical protein